MKCVHIFTLAALIMACGTDSRPPAENEDSTVPDVSQDQSVDVPDAISAVTDAMLSTPMLDGGIGPVSSDPSVLIINEVLYDPGPAISGDANSDGHRDAYEDEFIEFVNRGELPLNAGGLIIYDEQSFGQGTPRHLIPDNTIIPAGGALVVFGGGVPTGDFGGAIVQVANGYNQQLNINNSGEVIRVFSEGEEILSFDCAPFSDDPNASYTRWPDVTGAFTHHGRIDFNEDGNNDEVPYTPGRRSDGTPFIQ